MPSKGGKPSRKTGKKDTSRRDNDDNIASCSHQRQKDLDRQLEQLLGPMSHVPQTDKLAVMRYLVQQGASIHNTHALQFAAGMEYGGAVYLEELLALGGNVQDVDEEGNTPLHIAAYAGIVENVRVLLRHGANKNARDNKGATPLDCVHERQRGFEEFRAAMGMPAGAGINNTGPQHQEIIRLLSLSKSSGTS